MKMNDIDRIPNPDEPKVLAPLCRHLRCKGMYVTGEMLADPHAMPYDATVWWCSHTQKPVGPDDGPCHRDDCRAGRKCFEPSDPA
jgi:hypothetical protein